MVRVLARRPRRGLTPENPEKRKAESGKRTTAFAGFQRRLAPFLFQHSTIAQELLAGARDEAGYRAYHEDWVAPFEDLRRIITPAHATWTRAARERGFILVTRNEADFELIRRVEPQVDIAAPWPER
jgi:hypothetical protein